MILRLVLKEWRNAERLQYLEGELPFIDVLCIEFALLSSLTNSQRALSGAWWSMELWTLRTFLGKRRLFVVHNCEEWEMGTWAWSQTTGSDPVKLEQVRQYRGP